MILNVAPVLGQMVKDTADDIQAKDTATSLKARWISASATFDLMLRLAADNKPDSGFASFGQQFFRKAQDAGYGQERISALMKTPG